MINRGKSARINYRCNLLNMKNLFKKSIIAILLFLVLPINVLFAQEDKQDDKTDQIFKARVVEIVKEQNVEVEKGKFVMQQNIKLEGIEGKYKGKEFMVEGIGNLDVVGKNLYAKGDEVLAIESRSDDGSMQYYISDFVRNKSINVLFVLFLIALLAVGRLKGVRAIVSLVTSFAVIVYYIIPQILGGADAIIVTIIGSIAILFSIIYLTEGFNRSSNIATGSIFICLVFTVFLSWFFVKLCKLSGTGSEEIAFLVNLKDVTINFKGLLLSGIIIGTLGVLDDVIISQISAVEELYKANELLSKKEVFKSAYNVGVSHISSMSNTLFLAYTGASFPLLLLFFSGQSAFRGLSDVLNNESIATEIVRTLAGSIGLILAVPISTWMAVMFVKKK